MKSSIAALFFAALASAQVIITNSDFDGIEAGEPFEITWDDAEGPVTLTLKSGPSDNLETVTTITSGAIGDSFLWTPSSDIPTGQYAFEISDGTNINYSEQFGVEGGAAASSSAASSTRSASLTASSSATRSSSTTASSTSSSTTSSSSSTESSSSTTSTESSSTASSTSSTTSTSTRTTSSAASPSQTTPPSNDAQGVVAPLVAPFLMAVGAALI